MGRYTETPFSIAQFVIDLIEAVLILRFILLFFGANPAAGFVSFIYGATNPLVQPFKAIFTPAVIGSFTIDWATLLSLVAYALLGAIIMRLIQILIAPVERSSSPK